MIVEYGGHSQCNFLSFPFLLLQCRDLWTGGHPGFLEKASKKIETEKDKVSKSGFSHKRPKDCCDLCSFFFLFF